MSETEEEVKRNWEQIKLKEKGGNKRILDGVPKSLPAMVKAQRIQEKANGGASADDVKDTGNNAAGNHAAMFVSSSLAFVVCMFM